MRQITVPEPVYVRHPLAPEGQEASTWTFQKALSLLLAAERWKKSLEEIRRAQRIIDAAEGKVPGEAFDLEDADWRPLRDQLEGDNPIPGITDAHVGRALMQHVDAILDAKQVSGAEKAESGKKRR